MAADPEHTPLPLRARRAQIYEQLMLAAQRQDVPEYVRLEKLYLALVDIPAAADSVPQTPKESGYGC
jgi:hypothetical protein